MATALSMYNIGSGISNARCREIFSIMRNLQNVACLTKGENLVYIKKIISNPNFFKKKQKCKIKYVLHTWRIVLKLGSAYFPPFSRISSLRYGAGRIGFRSLSYTWIGNSFGFSSLSSYSSFLHFWRQTSGSLGWRTTWATGWGYQATSVFGLTVTIRGQDIGPRLATASRHSEYWIAYPGLLRNPENKIQMGFL